MQWSFHLPTYVCEYVFASVVHRSRQNDFLVVLAWRNNRIGQSVHSSFFDSIVIPFLTIFFSFISQSIPYVCFRRPMLFAIFAVYIGSFVARELDLVDGGVPISIQFIFAQALPRKLHSILLLDCIVQWLLLHKAHLHCTRNR